MPKPILVIEMPVLKDQEIKEQFISALKANDRMQEHYLILVFELPDIDKMNYKIITEENSNSNGKT